jgi:putative protease
VELLAPAGSEAALIAAVNNGADAVYVGLRELNARRGADNLDLEGLERACRFAHLRGARVYLTANILIMPEEFSGALTMVDAAWAAGIDAVIVQDFGLMRALRQALPEVRVHASTQINAHAPDTVDALAALGVSRVTLAREVPLAGIAAIVEASPVEVESFVHGALCYCYSGQCLMSSAIGGRSANRGLCAQPCRLPYTLIGERGEAAVPGRHLLSPKDLAGIAHLPALIASGVAALKIEGRMKAPEYVAVVTHVYRAALDRALAAPDTFAVTDAEWALLDEAFSRGFTDGYLVGDTGNELMSYQRPNNRGVLVGRVTAVGDAWAELALERAIDAEDTIESWTGRGRTGQRVGELTVDGHARSSASAGSRVRLTLSERVAEGDRVFRVANAAMLAAARRTFEGSGVSEVRATPVVLGVELRVGEPHRVTATAGGATASAEGPVVEAARTKAVTLDEVVEQIGRLGGSGYEAERWDIDLDHGVGIGFSALHHARRDALAALDASRLRPWAGRTTRNPALPQPPTPARRAARAAVVVSVPDVERALAALEAGAGSALLRVTATDDVEALPDRVEALLPRIATAHEAVALLGWARAGARITVGTLGALRDGAALGASVAADWTLNIANAWSAAALADFGARMVWASPELSGRRLKALASASPVPVGVLVFGRLELMIAEHCVLRAIGPCDRRCDRCARRAGRWVLRDEKGYEFPVTTDRSGRAHIANSVTLDLTRALDEVLEAGVSAVRIEITDEPVSEVARIVRAVVGAVESVSAGIAPPTEPIASPATSGHFFRGVR